MKKLVFALCMMFGGVVAVNAQDTTSTSSPTDPTATQQSQTSQSQASTMQDEGRVKIKSQDLPDAVKSALEGQEFRGWLVNSAYKVDGSAVSTSQSGSTTSASDSTNVSSSSSSSSDVSSSTGVSSSAGAQSGSQEIYIVELKNGAQTKTVKFDKDGKKLEDEGMEDDQD
jgi:hypothetical protein